MNAIFPKNKCTIPKNHVLPLDILKDNAIIYVLIAWVVTIVTAKALKLQNHGFELKPYSLVYKNANVQGVLDKILTRTRRGIRVFADVSVIAGFLMMGFAFWFLISNISAYFVRPMEFSEVTVLIPGVTLTSSSAILNFLLSIPIVLIIHEGAHGIVATLERIKIKTGGFAVFIAMFAGFVEPSCMISTIGIESKKLSIADDDVSVTPGMRTVTSENSIGRTKYADMLDIRNQNANPIMRNPAMTLTSAKTLIPLLVRVRILSSTPCTLAFLYTRLYGFSSKP